MSGGPGGRKSEKRVQRFNGTSDPKLGGLVDPHLKRHVGVPVPSIPGPAAVFLEPP